MSAVAPAPDAPTWDERGSIIAPRSPAFWLFAFLIAVGAFGTFGRVAQLTGETSFVSQQLSHGTGSALLAMTLLIAWAIPVVYVIHALDLFEREPFGMLAAAFAWGYLAAANLVVPGNVAIGNIVAKLGSAHLAADWGASFSAPVVEETFKALGLLLLVLIAAREIDSPVDGLVYGAFVGLGFQIEEDFWYLTTHTSGLHGVWSLFILRAIVDGVWSHAAYTGLVGLGIGYLVSRPDIPRTRRVQLAVLAFAGAWLLHFIWDSPWLGDWWSGGFGLEVLASIVKGVPGFLLIAALYFHARRREARWVEKVLAPEVATGAATAGEIQALVTFRGRREERAAAKRAGGMSAARRVKELQREQVALAVDLTRSRGAATEEVERHRATIAHIRALLPSLPRTPAATSS